MLGLCMHADLDITAMPTLCALKVRSSNVAAQVSRPQCVDLCA